jgi:hypothetical protein
MKRIPAFLLIALLLAATAAVAQDKEIAEPKKAQATQPVTHAQLADLLVKAVGLVRFLPTPSTAQQTFDLLMQNGISPEQGWLLDAVVTKADLSRVIVQALRKEDAVENPNDPQSWIDTLKAMGISLDRLSETIQSVEVMPEGMGQDVTLQSTDPLIYQVDFAPGDTQFTVDLSLVTRVFTEIEMVNGDFRPVPPTPF